ncbi:Protein N-acetyltransferase, RimJ/RimL family [Frankineae bacterium MT45]|nr:Protein N-acetyltransferase, RimJ/RimL family [Frankineae bacterium MT45]
MGSHPETDAAPAVTITEGPPLSPQRSTILTTPRLALTTWVPADSAPLNVVHSDPETMRFIRSGRPESLAETEQLVASYIEEQETRGWTKWRLTDAQDRLVGRAGFGPDGHARELGYTLRRDVWGQGLATEIAAALVDWHLNDTSFAGGLSAIVIVGHSRSAQVLKKVGFSEVGERDVAGQRCWSYRLG